MSSSSRISRMIILGHRGEGCTNRNPSVLGEKLSPRNDPFYQNKILPENSLSSFESALLNGADGLECDVYPSKDDVPMVIHDTQLARNVDGHHRWGKDQDEDCLGEVSDYTAAELREKFTIGNGEHIPTLNEFIQLLLKHNPEYKLKHGRNYTINIEIKGGDRTAKCAHAVVNKYLEDPTCPFDENDFLFNSFEIPSMQGMKKLESRLRCAMAFATKDIYQCAVRMPGWIPEAKDYSSSTIPTLSKIVDEMSLSGLDAVSSDILDSLASLCSQKKIFLAAATNAVRLKIEAEIYGSEEAKWTELQREEKEVSKLAHLSKKYDIPIFYRADNAGHMKRYVRKLDIEDVTSAEKEKTIAYLERNRSSYDPRLMASLRDHMREFQQITHDDMGIALAKTFGDVLDKELNTKLAP